VAQGYDPVTPADNSLVLIRAYPSARGQSSASAWPICYLPMPLRWLHTIRVRRSQRGLGLLTQTEGSGFHRATRRNRTPWPPTIHRRELYHLFSGSHPFATDLFYFVISILYEEVHA